MIHILTKRLPTGASIALLVFCFFVISYNIAILQSVVFSPHLSLITKATLIANIFYGHVTDISLNLLFSILIAVLFAINALLIVAYISLYKAASISFFATLSSGSILTAFLGAGCFTCGSLVSAFLAMVLGASSVLVVLPFNGSEFGFLSILLLLISIFLLSKNMRR